MYIPHTSNEREAMLRTIGVEDLEALFQDVPPVHRFPQLNLPPPLTEMEVLAKLQEISEDNDSTRDMSCFLGAGAYHHYIPAAVDSILRRGEFFSAYTPYQPEVSQGTLQAIYEYQSLIVSLTGMEVCNASHYDGATAVAEAVNMAYAHFRGKRGKIVLSPSLHPHYLETVKTYSAGSSLTLVGLDSDPLNLPDALIPHIDTQTALVFVQYPDFLGRIFDYRLLSKVTHDAGALLGVAVNPLALGLLTPPGEFGADIVTGEGQPLGIPLSFGGPYLGLFATRKEYVRKMAGRLVGETIDTRGQKGYVLTLTAREQHIRREKATSNICTNQGLMALASAVYLSLLGKYGLRQVAELNYHKAHYAARKISKLKDYSIDKNVTFFNEFLVHCPLPVDEINTYLLDYGILGGFNLATAYPDNIKFKNSMLLAITEMNSKDEIDFLVDVLEEVAYE